VSDQQSALAPRGLLDTSVVISLGRVPPEQLPAEPAIAAITFTELTAGPHATDDEDERARRQDRLQRVEAPATPTTSSISPRPASTPGRGAHRAELRLEERPMPERVRRSVLPVVRVATPGDLQGRIAWPWASQCSLAAALGWLAWRHHRPARNRRGASPPGSASRRCASSRAFPKPRRRPSHPPRPRVGDDRHARRVLPRAQSRQTTANVQRSPSASPGIRRERHLSQMAADVPTAT
jgi:hypothetical protein